MREIYLFIEDTQETHLNLCLNGVSAEDFNETVRLIAELNNNDIIVEHNVLTRMLKINKDRRANVN